MPHIDYDYYDYIDEQEDKNRRRHGRMIFIRVLFAVFIGAVTLCGLISLFQSCA